MVTSICHHDAPKHCQPDMVHGCFTCKLYINALCFCRHDALKPCAASQGAVLFVYIRPKCLKEEVCRRSEHVNRAVSVTASFETCNKYQNTPDPLS